MKNYLFLSIIILFASFKPTTSKAQGWEAAAIPAVVAGAKYISNNWSKVGWVFKGMKHTPTYVEYADGTYITDTPRSYRKPTELLRHWAQPEYVNRYGRIVDFQMKINGQWRSVLNWRPSTRKSSNRVSKTRYLDSGRW